MIELFSAIINFLFWFLIGVFIGNAAFKMLHKKTHNPAPENTIIKHIPIIKTEIHNNVIYAYSVVDDTFVSQGTTLEEVAEVAYKYKKIDTALVTHENKNFWFVNGKTTPVNAKII